MHESTSAARMSDRLFGIPVATAQAQRDRTAIFALVAANAISLTGNQVTMFALPWFVLETTHSAIQTALVAASQMTAFLVASIAGGVFVDRFGPKWLSVVSDLVSGLSIAAIPVLMKTVGLEIWQILILAFVGAILDSPGGNARYGIITDLIDRTGAKSERVYSAFASADGAARIAGPILAGALIAWFGAVNALWVDAASFAVSAGLIAVLVPFTARPKMVAASFLGDVRAGWEYLRSRALLVRFIALIVCVNLTAVPLAAVVIPKVARDFYESSRTGGVMLAADGIGVILGGVIFGIIGRRLTPYRSMLLALSLLLVSLVVLGALFPVLISIVALALTGIGFGIMAPNNQTVFRRITDLEFRGRVLGVRDAVGGISSPAMVVIVGIALDQAPLRIVILGLAAINLAVLVWFLRERLFWNLNASESVAEPSHQAR
jgi:MFS family permease